MGEIASAATQECGQHQIHAPQARTTARPRRREAPYSYYASRRRSVHIDPTVACPQRTRKQISHRGGLEPISCRGRITRGLTPIEQLSVRRRHGPSQHYCPCTTSQAEAINVP